MDIVHDLLLDTAELPQQTCPESSFFFDFSWTSLLFFFLMECYFFSSRENEGKEHLPWCLFSKFMLNGVAKVLP